MPKLKPGDQAPDFTLPATDGSQLTLSSAWSNGSVILTFYRGDFCPVCNLYLHTLQESASQFREAGAQIVAVSADKSELESQTVERHHISFPVLSDPQRRAVGAYDVVYNEREGHAEPATFIISREGKILYESIISGPLGRPTPEDLMKIVRMTARRQDAA